MVISFQFPLLRNAFGWQLMVNSYKKVWLNENLLTEHRKIFRRKTAPITDNQLKGGETHGS